MAKGITFQYKAKKNTKRSGIHSKNASSGQNGYKKKSRGQGK